MRDTRLRIVKELIGKRLLEIAFDRLLTSILEDVEGDALDSVVAAFAVSKALARPDFKTNTKDPTFLKEGRVY